jgi:hypothetical protein
MIKAVTRLIVASAGLWLVLPAAAQFEIDPDHFGDPVPTVVQPCPSQSKGSMRTPLTHNRAQRHRFRAFEGTKSPARTLPSAAAVQHHRVSGASGVVRRTADMKTSEQSQLAPVAPPIRANASIALCTSRAGPSERTTK